MKLRTPWQAAAALGVRLPAASVLRLADIARISAAFGITRRRRRAGLVRLDEPPPEIHADDAVWLGWPTGGSWCE